MGGIVAQEIGRSRRTSPLSIFSANIAAQNAQAENAYRRLQEEALNKRLNEITAKSSKRDDRRAGGFGL